MFGVGCRLVVGWLLYGVGWRVLFVVVVVVVVVDGCLLYVFVFC